MEINLKNKAIISEELMMITLFVNFSSYDSFPVFIFIYIYIVCVGFIAVIFDLRMVNFKLFRIWSEKNYS